MLVTLYAAYEYRFMFCMNIHVLVCEKEILVVYGLLSYRTQILTAVTQQRAVFDGVKFGVA